MDEHRNAAIPEWEGHDKHLSTDGLVPDCGNSIADTLELPHSFTKLDLYTHFSPLDPHFSLI